MLKNIGTTLESLKDLPSILKRSEEVKSVVVFGSAVRPEDFVLGVSDIDVLAIVSGEPCRRRYSFYLADIRVDISVFKAEEVVEMAKRGEPLALILRKAKVLVDDGTFASLSLNPRVTKYTLRVLRRSTFVALGLALQHYFFHEYRRAVHHSYHSIRHLVRYLASKEGSQFIPISDEEIVEASDEEIGKLFLELATLRRRKPKKAEVLKALEKTMETIAMKLGLDKPKLSQVLELFKDGEAVDANTCEEGGHLVARISIISEGEYKVYRVSKEGVEHTKTIFCSDQ